MRTRRGFIRFVLSGLAIAIARPLSVIRAAGKKVAISLSKVKDLQKAGGSMILNIKDHKVLFIRYDDETMKAFCANCSHQNTLLDYDPKGKQLVCSKHGSRFDLDGNVINGPAEKSICTFDTEIRDDRIILTVDTEK